MQEYGQVIENASLKEYNTLKLNPTVKYLIFPYNEERLVSLISYLKNNNIKYYILGAGSNVILDDSYFDGAIIKLDNLNGIVFKNNEVTASAGVMLPELVKDALKRDYTNLSFAAMIPGNVGGSVMGNAGAYKRELLDYVKSVKVLTSDGEVKVLNHDEIEYSYRKTNLVGSIIISVTFTLEKGNMEKTREEMKENAQKRLASQPLEKPSVGSTFKNPEGYAAGSLIDKAGIKGYKIGDAQVSEKHANFIINSGNATFEDITNLIEYIQKKVYEEFKIELELEAKIIKWINL